jgi:hypothetical protein
MLWDRVGTSLRHIDGGHASAPGNRNLRPIHPLGFVDQGWPLTYNF